MMHRRIQVQRAIQLAIYLHNNFFSRSEEVKRFQLVPLSVNYSFR